MNLEFSQIEFERLVRGSFKHGWLQKRSIGFKAVIPRKRYFILCDDCLYWFKKDKTSFAQKGALDLVDMKIVESNVETLHIEKKSNGKVYILSGAEIEEWSKTLEATLTSLNSVPKELKLSDYGSESAMSKDAKLDRKSTGTSSGFSSAVSSLPNSNASSLLDGESAPPTPQADLEDSSSIDEDLIGRPFLTKETLEKHNSTMESMSDVFLTKESLEKHDAAMEGEFVLDITRVPTPTDMESIPEKMKKKKSKSVLSAISFFETLSGQDTLPRSKSARVRQRLFSKFGPETKSRLRAAPRPTSPSGRSLGGDKIPSETNIQIEDAVSDDQSLLSEDLRQTNLIGSRTLDDLADSLASMMSILDNMNDTIASQTQTNLFLFEQGECLLHPEVEKKRMPSVSVTSEPDLLRIPSDHEEFWGKRNSTYRLSIDYRARGSTAYTYTADKSAMSLISLHTADSDSVSSIPDVEDVDFDVDERFADIEEYIHSRLICKEPISMVDLTNCFKGKRLPKQAFRTLYDKIRKRIEIDRRISRRQPENLSQLSMVNTFQDSYFQGSTHDFCNELRRLHRLSTIYSSASDLVYE